MKKQNKNQQTTITGCLLEELLARAEANRKIAFAEPTSVVSPKLAPPALYEDAGQGYRANFTYPQE